ncbi:MAG: CoA ester lyase [Gemmatimonadetes bacterium]|nr:CoA ester lyase [Gemmatimonadota bacterium]
MRSMLFVPAGNPAVIAKAAASAADAVCIDLEDSVPTEQKAASRPNVVNALTTLDFGGKRRIFRVNGLDTSYTYRDLVDVVEAAGDHLDLVMIPKVGSPHDVRFVDRLLTQIEMDRGLTRRIGIEAQIETAAGFVWLREIAQASPRLESLIFGPGDYAASMRMPSSGIGAHDANDEDYPGHRWHAVMHGVVAAARANGLRAMDGPYAAYTDTAGFARSCRIARAMGFDGKQCIHPSQISTVHMVFSPTAEEIAHAQRVVDACERAAAEGKGAARLDGAMIDEASARMARVVLDQSRGGKER